MSGRFHLSFERYFGQIYWFKAPGYIIDIGIILKEY